MLYSYWFFCSIIGETVFCLVMDGLVLNLFMKILLSLSDVGKWFIYGFFYYFTDKLNSTKKCRVNGIKIDPEHMGTYVKALHIDELFSIIFLTFFFTSSPSLYNNRLCQTFWKQIFMIGIPLRYLNIS